MLAFLSPPSLFSIRRSSIPNLSPTPPKSNLTPPPSHPPKTPPSTPHTPPTPANKSSKQPPPQPPPPPPPLQIIANDIRTLINYVRTALRPRPRPTPRSSTGSSVATVYVKVLGAASRVAERVVGQVKDASGAMAGWRVLRPFIWQLEGSGESREDWRLKVREFVKSGEGVLGGVFKFGEWILRGIMRGTKQRELKQGVTRGRLKEGMGKMVVRMGEQMVVRPHSGDPKYVEIAAVEAFERRDREIGREERLALSLENGGDGVSLEVESKEYTGVSNMAQAEEQAAKSGEEVGKEAGREAGISSKPSGEKKVEIVSVSRMAAETTRNKRSDMATPVTFSKVSAPVYSAEGAFEASGEASRNESVEQKTSDPTREDGTLVKVPKSMEDRILEKAVGNVKRGKVESAQKAEDSFLSGIPGFVKRGATGLLGMGALAGMVGALPGMMTAGAIFVAGGAVLSAQGGRNGDGKDKKVIVKSGAGAGVVVEGNANVVMETQAYSVGVSQPAVLDVPVVGWLVGGLDDLAYWGEGIWGKVGDVVGRGGGRAEGWRLLGAFRRRR